MATAGQIVKAADFPDLATDTQDASGTSTATSYSTVLTGGTACGVTFVAPTSGKVNIHNTGQAVNSTAANSARIGHTLRTGGSIGSGTVVQAADDARALTVVGTDPMAATRITPITGLTPGATYNVQQAFRVSAGTGTYSNKSLSVVPVVG